MDESSSARHTLPLIQLLTPSLTDSHAITIIIALTPSLTLPHSLCTTDIIAQDRTIPITTSGKIARQWCKKAFIKGTLDAVHSFKDASLTTGTAATRVGD